MGGFEKIYMEFDSAAQETGVVETDAMSVQPVIEPTYEQYRHWHDSVGQPYGWHMRERINNQEAILTFLARAGVQLLLFVVDGKEVGYCLSEMEANGDVGISDFGFLPTETGKGYASYFIRLVTAHLAKSSTAKIWLSTRSTNDPRVVDFYAANGFRVVSRQEYSE